MLHSYFCDSFFTKAFFKNAYFQNVVFICVKLSFFEKRNKKWQLLDVTERVFLQREFHNRNNTLTIYSNIATAVTIANAQMSIVMATFMLQLSPRLFAKKK